MGEDEDGGVEVRLHVRERLVRPEDEELVALGIRSGVAKVARASATTVRQPSSFAARHNASAVSTAP
jgi:hypothetical protein